jgi:hypothetical protein
MKATRKQLDKMITPQMIADFKKNAKRKPIGTDPDAPFQTDAELKLFKRGRPTIENPKQILSFRADKKIADILNGLKNKSSVINDALKKHLIKLGML